MLQKKRKPIYLADKLAWSHQPIHLRSAANLETFLPGASGRCWLTPAGVRSTTGLDITRGGPGFFGPMGKDGEPITRGVEGITEPQAGVGKVPFGGGKSGESIIIGGIEATP